MIQHSDFHKQGIFIVKAPDGTALLDTCATTAYSARAEFIRRYNLLWSKAEAQGYVIGEFAQTGVVVSNRAKKEFSVPWTASAWALYGDHPNAGAAAQALGAKLHEKLQAALLLEETERKARAEALRDEMYEVMDQFADEGACDSEPEYALVQCIRTVLDIPDLSR